MVYMLGACDGQRRTTHAGAMRHDLVDCNTPRMFEEFSKFTRLPAEIRSMIWENSLPEARVYEVLDAPNAKLRTPAHKGLMFANVNPEPPPALAAVCRESRYFVLRHYKPLTLGSTTKYVDFSRDILLLEPYLLVKRLHRTLHFMSQIPHVRDGITRLALGTSYGIYTGICHPVLSWKVARSNMGKLLSGLARFPRLRTLIFVVHQEFQFDFAFRSPIGGLSPYEHSDSESSTGTSVSDLQQPPVQVSLPQQQLVHQAYRFKFDIEANINHRPRRPHLNELLYYPLVIDEDKEDELWDRMLLGGYYGYGYGGYGYSGGGGSAADDTPPEFCDPWPTNDDWRRFRKRFLRAVSTSLELNIAGGQKAENVPDLKGASLLWRYTRGGYV